MRLPQDQGHGNKDSISRWLVSSQAKHGVVDCVEKLKEDGCIRNTVARARPNEIGTASRNVP